MAVAPSMGRVTLGPAPLTPGKRDLFPSAGVEQESNLQDKHLDDLNNVNRLQIRHLAGAKAPTA